MKYEKVTSIEHLKELTKDRAEEFVLQLNFGLRSTKRIEWIEEEQKFWVLNYIDDSEQMLTEEQMKDHRETNIGKAIEMGAFWWEREETERGKE